MASPDYSILFRKGTPMSATVAALAAALSTSDRITEELEATKKRLREAMDTCDDLQTQLNAIREASRPRDATVRPDAKQYYETIHRDPRKYPGSPLLCPKCKSATCPGC